MFENSCAHEAMMISVTVALCFTGFDEAIGLYISMRYNGFD